MCHWAPSIDSPTPSQIQAVIFDFDGTLVNSVEVLMDFLLLWGNRYGGHVTKEDFLQLNGMSIAAAIRTLLKEGKLKKRSLVRMLLQYRSLKQSLHSNTSLYPYALECVGKVAEQYPLAIATSGSRKHVHHFTEQFGLQEYFPHIVSREDVTEKKPQPEPFLKAAQALNIPPEQCLVIEDSPNGVLAGKRAGMTTCVVLHTTPQEYFQEQFAPDFFLEDLSQLPLRLEQFQTGLLHSGPPPRNET